MTSIHLSSVFTLRLVSTARWDFPAGPTFLPAWWIISGGGAAPFGPTHALCLTDSQREQQGGTLPFVLCNHSVEEHTQYIKRDRDTETQSCMWNINHTEKTTPELQLWIWGFVLQQLNTCQKVQQTVTRMLKPSNWLQLVQIAHVLYLQRGVCGGLDAVMKPQMTVSAPSGQFLSSFNQFCHGFKFWMISVTLFVFSCVSCFIL